MGEPEVRTPNLNPVTDQEIGRRLRIARVTAEVTQANAASEIGVARTTLVAIEQGLRRIRTAELLRLARFYGVTANSLLRREAVHIDLVPRFRRSHRTRDEATEFAAKLMNHLVRAEVELEQALGVKRDYDYPRQRPLHPGEIRGQAEEDAAYLRRWLGLGSGPVLDVPSLAEIQLGIRVYQCPIESSISGLFAWDQSVGACMLLNSKHRIDRIQFSAAHELGHFIAARGTPTVLMSTGRPNSRIEKYANHFASAFLMPGRLVRQRFAEIVDEQTRLTRRHVILLAHMFRVSRAALVRRLEELELVRRGSWEWFQEQGGITDMQSEQVVDTISPSSADDLRKWPLGSIRLSLLVQEAWERELYSEGQLSRMLRLSRHEFRRILFEASAENREVAVQPH